MWDYGTGALVQTIPWQGTNGKLSASSGPCLVYAAQYSKKRAEYIAAGGSGANEVKVFDRKTGKVRGSLRASL